MPQECHKERRLLAGSLTFSAVSTESQWVLEGSQVRGHERSLRLTRIPPVALYRPPQQCCTCLVVTQLIRLHGNQRGM